MLLSFFRDSIPEPSQPSASYNTISNDYAHPSQHAQSLPIIQQEGILSVASSSFQNYDFERIQQLFIRRKGRRLPATPFLVMTCVAGRV